eukprot:gene33981-45528_t
MLKVDPDDLEVKSPVKLEIENRPVKEVGQVDTSVKSTTSPKDAMEDELDELFGDFPGNLSGALRRLSGHVQRLQVKQ